ncbi:hypothetical protein RCO28_38680 [Streptomyces sp. LHD-70]|nr:hypothetical protein [Streptomyces sp. LHD-70]MDQ8708342.1 hypothetical protein [Streptomyces sp. LHD-70]
MSGTSADGVRARPQAPRAAPGPLDTAELHALWADLETDDGAQLLRS